VQYAKTGDPVARSHTRILFSRNGAWPLSPSFEGGGRSKITARAYIKPDDLFAMPDDPIGDVSADEDAQALAWLRPRGPNQLGMRQLEVAGRDIRPEHACALVSVEPRGV
jgi:hypothetical protein